VVNNKLKAMSESWPFQKPVNKKLVKDYYEIIKKPMDLEAVAKKVKCKSLLMLILHFINLNVCRSQVPQLPRILDGY